MFFLCLGIFAVGALLGLIGVYRKEPRAWAGTLLNTPLAYSVIRLAIWLHS